MSIITKLAKEVGELSDDAVRALRRVLPKNATVAQAKDAYERIMRELPEEIDFSVPRRRVKPKVRLVRPDPEDADPDKWLQRARTEAAERYSVHNRLPGKVTASVKGRVELDPKKLANIPGAMGERRVPGDEKYDRLMASVQEKGFDPNTHIWLGVNHLGEPYVAEGNTRLAVARDLGIDRIPAEVMWYGGGEQVGGLMEPGLLEHYMPPSELMLDPNFRRWFGDSKAVDEYGEPLMLYHGTDRQLSAFDLDARRRGDAGAGADYTDTGWFGKGIYLTPSARAASGYAGTGEGANVLPLFVSMKNPFKVKGLGGRDMDRFLGAAGAQLSDIQLARGWRLPSEQTEWLKSQGYDGVHAFDPSDPGAAHEYVVFDPTQIKSATGNRGTYDPSDPDIRKARGGLAVKRKRKRGA